MRLLRSIIGIPIRYMANLRHRLAMSDGIAAVLSLQSTGINRTQFNVPETDRFAADGDAAFCREILDIAVT
jgi:hypothetical protein